MFYYVTTDTLREQPYDRDQFAGLLAVFVFHSWMTGILAILTVERESYSK